MAQSSPGARDAALSSSTLADIYRLIGSSPEGFPTAKAVRSSLHGSSGRRHSRSPSASEVDVEAIKAILSEIDAVPHSSHAVDKRVDECIRRLRASGDGGDQDLDQSLAEARILPIENWRGADGQPEWILPPSPQPRKRMLFLHGGGYEHYSPVDYRPLTTRLAASCGIPILVIDYRRCASAGLDPPTSGSSHPCCPPCLLTSRSLDRNHAPRSAGAPISSGRGRWPLCPRLDLGPRPAHREHTSNHLHDHPCGRGLRLWRLGWRRPRACSHRSLSTRRGGSGCAAAARERRTPGGSGAPPAAPARDRTRPPLAMVRPNSFPALISYACMGWCHPHGRSRLLRRRRDGDHRVECRVCSPVRGRCRPG